MSEKPRIAVVDGIGSRISSQILATLAAAGFGLEVPQISVNQNLKRGRKLVDQVGAKQTERYKKQGLRNVNVNGFSLIQRG